MKKITTYTIAFLTLGVFASFEASASWKYNQCRREAPIDATGMAYDSNSDGKTTIAEVAIANPLNNLSTLVFAVTNADPAILDALSDPGQSLTVFAPTDEAFADLPPEILNSGIIAGEPINSTLTNTLLYHVVDDKFDPRRVRYIRKVDTLLGENLYFARGRTQPAVNNSQISCTGVKTDNGWVWLIDKVLLPQYSVSN